MMLHRHFEDRKKAEAKRTPSESKQMLEKLLADRGRLPGRAAGEEPALFPWAKAAQTEKAETAPKEPEKAEAKPAKKRAPRKAKATAAK